MSFIGLLRTLEQITRPPRMGHDDDRPLPDYEPVSPDGYYGYAEPDLGESICGTQHFGSKARHQCSCILAADHPNEGDCHLCGCGERFRDMWDDHYSDTPNPAEPGLTDDELVGVRGLLQERYGYAEPDLGDGEPDVILNNQINPAWWAKHHHEFVTKSSASNHAGTGAEPAPSPTIANRDEAPTVDGEGPASVRDIQPSPEAGRPTSELLTEAAELILVCKTGQIPLVWLSLVDELRDRAATFEAIEE